MSSSKKPQQGYTSPLEALRDIGWEVQGQIKEQVSAMPQSAYEQITGQQTFGGEIHPGGTVEMQEVLIQRESEEIKYQKQALLEKQLREEERILVESRTNEIRIQIEAIRVEIVKLAEATPELHREVEIAAFQAPIEASTYELYFLERLFEFIKSFRQKIEDAHVWLQVANARASKKNMWGQNLKKYGAKYLLSGEHYLSRSNA